MPLPLTQFAYRHLTEAMLLVLALLCAAGVVLAARATLPRRRADAVTLPAILQFTDGSWLSIVRHIPLLLFVAGLPFFILALSDPYLPLVQRETSVIGRRIALLIDGSSSMGLHFPAPGLNGTKSVDSAYFAAVNAASHLVDRRGKNGRRDFFALLEFGDQTYVITPFTNDYQNVLLSLSLIGDEHEFARFPSRGTTVADAIGRSIDLFRAFDFLDTAGNLIVIFSDGRDLQARDDTRAIDAIMNRASSSGIPVWFVRTAYGKRFGSGFADDVWRVAVEKSGGRFYPAADEATIVHAVEDIDRLSEGKTQVRDYEINESQFSRFALAAIVMWMAAIVLKLAVPQLSKFP